MARGSKFRFRRIYPYICRGCGKKRGTKIYSRRVEGFCTLCRRNKVDKNQMSLIGAKDTDEVETEVGISV